MQRKLAFLCGGFAAAIFAAHFLADNTALLVIGAVLVAIAAGLLLAKKLYFPALFLICGVLLGFVWNSVYRSAFEPQAARRSGGGKS